jgi:hypothetical protein
MAYLMHVVRRKLENKILLVIFEKILYDIYIPLTCRLKWVVSSVLGPAVGCSFPAG